jgi:hypothetical protein
MIKLSNLITEAGEKNFTNPALNKKVKYKNSKGEDTEGIVGNLLRLPKDNPGRIAAEKTLPKDGTPERKAINKSLGREKGGKSVPTAANTKKGGDKKPQSSAEKGAEPQQAKPAAMYKSDAAMSARMDTEKDTLNKLAKDAEAEKAAHSSDGDDKAGLRKNIKTAVTKPKVYARAIKDGIKDWKEDEKEFFKEKVHKGDTPKRRSWGQALKDKAVGAWHAIKKGAEHEVETFKKAGEGVVMWANGMPLTDEQTDAMKSVAKKVVVAGVLGVVTGGLSHGVMPFIGHIMTEFVPHIVGETVLAGIAKAAVFAGPLDMNGGKEDEAIQKFMDAIAEKVAKEDIPVDIIAKAVESYNKEKEEKGGEGITQNEARLAVNQLQQLVKESIIR